MQLPKLFHNFYSANFTSMKIFIRYIIDHFKTDFNLKAHIYIGLFLTITLLLNYLYPQIADTNANFYDTIILNYYQQPLSFVYLFLFYSFAFLSTIVIVSLTSGAKIKPISNRNFIVFGLVGLFFLGLDCSYYLMKYADIFYVENGFVSRWIHACVSNLASLFTIIIPLYILYAIVKHFKPEFYGLKLNGAHVLPYFWLILFMIPLIYLASFQPDFLEAYPTYTDYYEYKFLEVDQKITAGIYELCYGFDFLSVELFFRGFMVIALSKFVGKEAILPMVVVYCFLHFGKPAGEAISSIFGGYILGILAYSSRNIYGGLIAHLGVAWGMEYMAYVQLNW